MHYLVGGKLEGGSSTLFQPDLLGAFYYGHYLEAAATNNLMHICYKTLELALWLVSFIVEASGY